jgi:hypothetical protein
MWSALGFFILIVLVGGGFYVLRQQKSMLNGVTCPRCGTVAPFFRKPTSLRQALWGGWTCANCGCNMDRWGKEITK